MRCSVCDLPAASNPVECQECCDESNRLRLLLLPTPLGDTKQSEKVGHDQRISFNAVVKTVDKMTLDELFVFMKKAEAVAAGAGLAYNQRLMKLRVSPEDVETRKKDQQSFAGAARQARVDNLPKKERRLLSDRDKAIEQLMKFMDREAATASVDSQMSKQGRLVKVDA